MKSHLHFNALRAVEAAARHQSFSGAAAELHVSPAAIGQLVRALEEQLGTALFRRDKVGRQRLTPTETTERALPDIRAGLDRLTSAMGRLQQSARNASLLTVTASPAFASKWLLPRLDRFQLACPETDVRLHTGLKLMDLERDGVDVAVRYGRGVWPGVVAELLMEEEIFPACSPVWLDKHGPVTTPKELAGSAFIHDLSVDTHLGFMSWNEWLHRAGADGVDASRGMQVDNSASVLQAIAEGRGIGLARSVMAQDDLRSGRVVRMFPGIKVASPLSYYLVYSPHSSSLPKLLAFKSWLHAEARRSDAAD